MNSFLRCVVYILLLSTSWSLFAQDSLYKLYVPTQEDQLLTTKLYQKITLLSDANLSQTKEKIDIILWEDSTQQFLEWRTYYVLNSLSSFIGKLSAERFTIERDMQLWIEPRIWSESSVEEQFKNNVGSIFPEREVVETFQAWPYDASSEILPLKIRVTNAWESFQGLWSKWNTLYVDCFDRDKNSYWVTMLSVADQPDIVWSAQLELSHEIEIWKEYIGSVVNCVVSFIESELDRDSIRHGWFYLRGASSLAPWENVDLTVIDVRGNDWVYWSVTVDLKNIWTDSVTIDTEENTLHVWNQNHRIEYQWVIAPGQVVTARVQWILFPSQEGNWWVCNKRPTSVSWVYDTGCYFYLFPNNKRDYQIDVNWMNNWFYFNAQRLVNEHNWIQ